jgi:hypothetical protein
MTRRTASVGCAAALLMLVGCSASGGASTGTTSSAPAARDTSAAAPHSTGPGPSAPAKMICSDDIRAAVKKTFGLPTTPRPTDSYANQVYRCTYPVGGGSLILAVQDAPDVKSGAAFYTGLKAQLSQPQPVEEFDTFGLPAFQTPDGRVALIKDGKTLLVDATGVPATSLPDGFKPTDAAYTIASAVVGCWTGD